MVQTDDESKKIKSISDLISESKTNGKSKVNVSEDVVSEKFSQKMQEIRIKELEEVTQQQAASLGYPYIDLKNIGINSETLYQIPEKIAKQEKVICFYKTDQIIKIASTNPDNPKLAELVKTLKEKTTTGIVDLYLISENTYNTKLELYEKYPAPRLIKTGIQITGKELTELQKKIKNFGVLNIMLNSEKNITQLIKIIMAGAIQADASDIHIEPEENKITLRYRIDGVLHVTATLDKKIWQRLDSRLKGIAGLKINITDKPQDGRITVYLEKDDKLEIRVSALPSSYGESLVMRLLRSKVESLKFEDLGIRGKASEDLNRQIERPTGMIVTTGPTGSGKTTSLYAILNKLNNPETKIITLEDPVEYKLEGITQSQIDHSKGYSFADGLRSILRQDPDIIMVGELRDLETSEVAVQAALTGHKVVSTLHTNDAAGAIPRFLSIGVKSYLLAPALNAVIGQRLVRKVHDKCKIEYKPEPALIERIKEKLADLPPNSGYTIDFDKLKFYRGQGCDECNHIGLKGRVGIYEIFTITNEIEKEILSGQTSEYKIRQIAHDNGMISMVQDGILKALDGMTTPEEVFRVTE